MYIIDADTNTIVVEDPKTAEDLFKAVENITGKRTFVLLSQWGPLPRDSEPLTRDILFQGKIRVLGVRFPKPAVSKEDQMVKYVLTFEGNITIPPAEESMRQDDLLAIIESEIRGSLIDSSVSSATIGQRRDHQKPGTLLTNVRTEVVIPTISDPIQVTFTPTAAAAASFGGRKKGKSKSKSIRRKQPRRRSHSRSQKK